MQSIVNLKTKMFSDVTQQCFALLPWVNFPSNNLNFHWRWRSWDRIQAVFSNIFEFTKDRDKLKAGYKLTLTLMLSLAEVSKNSRPKESAKCLPLSKEITRSSSMSHLLPTKITCALSQEYVLICVHLK